ncbi:MAG: NAD(P)-dependent oxidoreductase [Gammaproteobacteria bacterium]|nr:NAD(P)-dependent oxidoreductase [Sideroxydans sp.]MBU3904048.1 NAD(P)-dependent oxidoreductase [Gammaproteobacteria bacterium]MBU4046248.1 NAD(P)-dependent oxidoreductase [Gammaproteobacteria bacterium]
MLMQRTSIVEEDVRRVLEECRGTLQKLSGKTLLLTGGSGFVGSYLVESIIAFNRKNEDEPCRLLLPTRSVAQAQKKWPQLWGIPHIEWFEWDGSVLSHPCDHCDYVIHAASPADPASYLHDPMQTMEDIANGTRAVLHFARRSGVRTLLYLSSGAAYGRQGEACEALDETATGAPDLSDPVSCYGEAKRYSELLCRTSGVPTIVARLFAFMGPYQDLSGSFAVPDFIRQALYEKRIRIQSDGSSLRTYCYASDLTIGLWELLMNGSPGDLYNVGADAPQVSIRELAEQIAELVGSVDVEVEGVSSGSSRSRYIPNTDKFKNLYTPLIGLQEGLRRMIDSFRQTGYQE